MTLLALSIVPGVRWRKTRQMVAVALDQQKCGGELAQFTILQLWCRMTSVLCRRLEVPTH